ncbi:MAG: NUDIX hydrolase [Candidatus Hodarchaeales archaeon]|jgi:mutator protein MutT
MASRKYPSRPWVSAHAVIFNKMNKVLLTKRAAPPKANYWFPPGGAIDLGETVEWGLRREIKEETNIIVSNLNLLDYIDGITHDAENKILYHYVVLIFTADYLEGEVLADDDALDAQWFSSSDIINEKIPIPNELIRLIKRIKK